MSKISDGTYHELAEHAYTKKSLPVKIKRIDKTETWRPLKLEGTVLHDQKTGFDAKIYVNNEMKEVVVSFRGTQGDEIPGEGTADVVTDVKDVVFHNLKRNKELLEKLNKNEYAAPSFDLINRKALKKDIESSQFTQADHLMRDVKKYATKHLDGYTISVTGHSLGGALAEYVAAIHNVKSVSFSTPSIVELLPGDLQRKAKNGGFDPNIVAYVHPSDSIGAGAFGADAHVGRTVYIDETFEVANADKDRPIKRFLDSIGEPDYHGLGNFAFDSFGNFKNLLIDAKTQKIIMYSPNYISGRSIELDPDIIATKGANIRFVPQLHTQTIPTAISAIADVKDQAKNAYTSFVIPLIDEICEDLYAHKEWYTKTSKEIGDFIEQKANDFKSVDQQRASEIKG
ncbi:hypothetical protein [Bacillus sp. FJAT-47783]|uniref:lipase family protein n=1 Tax=Bacillus sp. FJAT-47783 TaxID=2922712 RepID=UPI001FAB78B5|nr:hypothetical protein [Bacillus sp. FJAT-47783]